ncbi:MAG TPA: condensation domain-containing protein [Jatrophihabitans sp.]|nr:condensation domain-containing protein [Jatrophihabitans sp.]
MTVTEVHPPVSRQQLFWCTPELSDAFSPRFIICRALRITGRIDQTALQAALDDVVARHEMLRTVVVRDGQPPYQRIHPPAPVRLTVRELPPTPPEARQRVAEEQLVEAEESSVEIGELPLLRAGLARFDDRDSVLSLVCHHSACDGWSMNLLVRDLVECYAARTGERPLNLPDAPPYQDYARWQLATIAEPGMAAKMAYWQRKLKDARLFTLPTDHPIPRVHTAPHVRHPFTVDGEVAAAIRQFIKAQRCSGFMLMLAVFNLLAHRISGTLDPAVSTMVHGRGEPRFKNTVGLFLNFPTMRTDLSGCRSFREVIRATRTTCLEAYENEVPHWQLLEAMPEVGEPLADPSNSYVVFGYWDASLTGATGEPYEIGESASVIRKRSRVSEKLPSGACWNMGMSPSGDVGGGLQYSPEVFEEATVAGWVSEFCRLLAAAMADPDQDWQRL